VAAVDCGTNSVRLLIADLPADRTSPLVDVVRRMEIVRLGEGVDRTGRLSSTAIERTRVALADYAAEVTDSRADRVRMVATSATRDAGNSSEFHDMVVATLGVEPEVVTGDEEARLSFLGAVRGLPASSPPPYLVVDIGGGSTEFVLGGAGDDAATVANAVSVDIGCVRMTERHLRDDPPNLEQIAAAEADIRAGVDRALEIVPAHHARTLIGLAGSVTTVAALALRPRSLRPVADSSRSDSICGRRDGHHAPARADPYPAAHAAADASRPRRRDRGRGIDPARTHGACRGGLGRRQ
jgi:exopolyphosphatase/guanosine-5'-triphosphate,3'-diphosphate pyrophosphatase